MDETIKDDFLQTTRWQSILASAVELHRLHRNFKETVESYDYRIEETKRHSVVDPNTGFRQELTTAASELNMDAFMLDYMMSHTIPKLMADDPYVRETIEKLLVYAKLKEATDIAEHYQDTLCNAAAATKNNETRATERIQSFEYAKERVLSRYEEEKAGQHKQITRHKLWMVNWINANLKDVQGSDDLGEYDKQIVHILKEAGVISEHGTNIQIDQQKLELVDDLSFVAMVCKLRDVRFLNR